MKQENRQYKNILASIWIKFNQYKIYILIGFFLILIITISPIASIFWTLLLAGILYKIDIKFTAIPTLILLGLIPIFLVTKVDWLAEEFAVYIYYLLIITVIFEIKNYLIAHKIPKNSIVFLKPESVTKNSEAKLLSHRKKPLFTSEAFKFLSRIRFTKISIFRSIIVLISAIIPIIIFNFRGLPYFRDIVTVPYFYNLQDSNLTLPVVEKGIFNQLTKIGFGPEFLAESYFIIWFFLGTILSYIYLYRINKYFGAKNSDKKSSKYSTKVIIFILSLCYIYNLFTFERFLMGQHLVLRGHFLFIPVIYYLLEFFGYFLNPHPHSSKDKQEELGYKDNFITRINHFIQNEDGSNIYFDKLSKIGLITIILALISTHHTVFIYYIITISLILYIISNLIHRKEYGFNWKILSRAVIIIVLIFLPSFLVLFNKYYNNPQTTYYTSTINSTKTNSNVKMEILEAFSPRTVDGEKLTEKILLGGASWDSRSFIEPNKIQFKLGFLSSFSYYYNSLVGFLFIALFAVIIIYLTNRSDKNFSPILFPILIFIPISLVLSFGLSGRMASINRLFYLLPSSYTFREAGKFYSLFLACTSILVAAFVHLGSRRFKLLINTTLCLFFLSSILMFVPLAGSLQYIDLYSKEEGTIINYANKNCKPNKNVLSLPFSTYVDSSFGETYLAQPYKYSLDCNVLTPKNAQVESPNSDETINLFSTDLDNQINGIVNEFRDSQDPDQAYRIFQAQMKSLNINMLIVDEEKYPDLKVFNEKLSQKIAPEIQHDQLFLYKFDWIN